MAAPGDEDRVAPPRRPGLKDGIDAVLAAHAVMPPDGVHVGLDDGDHLLVRGVRPDLGQREVSSTHRKM